MSTDTTDKADDETLETLELMGMAGLLQRRLDAFKARLTGDLHLEDILERAALAYGRGDPSAAAFWLPTLREQAHWLNLFENPMEPLMASPSIAISSSRH